MRRIEVTASTLAQQNPGHVTLSKPYRWRKNPDWVPGHPDYMEPSGLQPGPETLAGRRAERIARFAEILAELGTPDPWTAPDANVVEAGGRVGVGEQTAKDYRNELKRRTLRDGEVRDA